MTRTVRLRDIGSTYGGLTGKSKVDFGHGDARFVTFVEVINSTRLRGRALERVRVAKGERQHSVERGDLLFNGSSETPEDVALSAVVDFDPDRSTFLNSFCFGFRLHPDADVEPAYLAYLFRSSAGRGLVAPLAQGATRYNIAKTKFLDLALDLPSRERQCEVVEALCDADDLVAALERKIGKKKAMRRGMMQALASGRARVPGHGGPWRTTNVSDLLDFKNGLNKASGYFGAGTPIVNFMDVMGGPIIRAADVGGLVTLTKDEIQRFSAKKGDLFFTRTSETVDEVGTAAVLVDDLPDASFSGFVLRGRPKTAVDPRFLARVFQLEAVRRQVIANATYTTRALTNGRSLGNVVVNVPDLDEQAAVADILADMDAEISLLDARLAKEHKVKIGMMQQLFSADRALEEASA